MDFENRYYLTDDMLKEYARRTQCGTYLILGIVLALGAAVRIAMGIINKNSESMVIFVAAFFAALFVAFGAPKIMFKELKNNDKAVHKGAKRPQTTVKFSDKIYVKEGSVSRDWEFSQVTKLYDLKSSYVLMTGKRTSVILARDGFVKGDLESFRKYIKEMCPGVREV